MKVMIVKTSQDRSFDEYYEKYLKYVSDARREKTVRMRSERDRKTSLAAELVLRLMIREALGISGDDIEFTFGEHGKPFLKNHENFYFSLSHSGVYAACVCSGMSAGVDIEQNSRGSERIAGRYFTENEYRKIYTEGSADFVTVWTAKEAYVKYTGNGLSEGLDTFDVLDGSTGCRFVSTELPDGYTVTVCTPSDEAVEFEIVTDSEVFEKINPALMKKAYQKNFL